MVIGTVVRHILIDMGMHSFSAGNGVGRLVHLHLVKKTNLVVYIVRDDGTDSCRICFTAHAYAIGENVSILDGLLLKITEVILPDSNRSMRALYHRNRDMLTL